MDVRSIFGRYWAASSPIHRLDARVKLIALAVLVILLFVASNFWALGILTLFIIGVFAVARIPFGVACRTVLPLTFIIVITALFNLIYVSGGEVFLDWGWLKVTADGLYSAGFVCLRLMLLLLLGALLTLTTTTIDITNAIESLLSPLKRVGVPVSEFAFVMGTALRFLPQFVDEFRIIRVAQDARGARLSTRPTQSMRVMASFVVPLFASVFRRADTLSAAMESRCYRPGNRLGRRNSRKLAVRDYVCFVVLACLSVAVTCISIFC